MRGLLHRLALYSFQVFVTRPVLRWIIGVRYRRRGPVPEGPCLVVSNHNSHLDAAVLLGLFPLRRLPYVHPVAAADYFGKTWFKRTMAMAMMNAVPLERRSSAGSDSLAPLVARLEAGETLILFPEGSRGEAGVVAPFRAGIGHLVKRVPGLLVVPTFLSGPERIWPRGEVVPVPLDMDVVSGKPRTYPPHDTPRAIAEQVQRDVLALAPPTPPAPGVRVGPSLHVAVCGPDPETRRTVFLRVTEQLGRSEPTSGIAEPVVRADREGLKEIAGPASRRRGRAWHALLAWIFRTSGWFKGDRFAKMVERAQLNEALAAQHAARFLVTDGSPLVDLMAWADADFYEGVFDEGEQSQLLEYLSGRRRIPMGRWWSFIRKAPEIWLVNVFDMVRPAVPDLVVNVGLPAASIMRRRRASGGHLGPEENEAFLERLSRSYADIGQLLRRRRKVELLEFDASRTDLDEIVREVEQVCLSRAGVAELPPPDPMGREMTDGLESSQD